MIGLFNWPRRAEPSIADARPKDAAALAAAHARSFRHGWSEAEFERLLADPAVVCHLVRSKSGVSAFVLSRVAADEAEILSIAVLPAERRRGIAGRLLGRHLARLAALGVTHVFLEVDDGNEAALRLYRRAGFEQVGKRPGYYQVAEGDGTALILRRNLD